MNFLKNYISTLLLIALGSIFYWKSTNFQSFAGGNLSLDFFPLSFPILSVFYWIIIGYVILLVPFYLTYHQASKARLVGRYLWKTIQGQNTATDQEKIALRAWIVKLFFLPLMIVWLSNHIFHLINNFYALTQNFSLFSTDFLLFFNSHFFWFAFNLILFSDVFFFAMGYLLEAPFLKNTIKSVEPSLLGWAVALMCYPPFNAQVTQLIGWYSTDFPQFWNMYVHIVLNILILILMGIYAWASVALGWKASNLTNRGIVSKWPYAYVRHPAYICKNTAWLIWGIPMLLIAIKDPNLSVFTVLFGLAGWAFLYYMRAMTEEIHLSSDPEYMAYKYKVPYKFIPKIW